MSHEPELPAEDIINSAPPEESSIPEKYRDRLLQMEKLLNQVEQGQILYRDLEHQGATSEKLPLEKTGTPYKREELEELTKQSAASYSKANYWISIVIAGVSLMVLPGFAGYLIDQQCKLTFWGPTGILCGMIAGLFYLIRTGESHKTKNKPKLDPNSKSIHSSNN